ncbi:MAG: ThiF family adenylyltransferase [Planctomycetota bacterium]
MSLMTDTEAAVATAAQHEEHGCRVVISAGLLNDRDPSADEVLVRFARLDGGEVYSALPGVEGWPTVCGVIRSVEDSVPAGTEEPPPCGADCHVQILAREGEEPAVPADAFVLAAGRWRRATLDVVPVRDQLFSRSKGLLESDRLSRAWVLTAGLGSGGAPIPLGLSQAGVSNHMIVDDDVLEVCNVARHPAGLRHVGRKKVHVLRDMITQINPYATVETRAEAIGWRNLESWRAWVRRADVVIAATGDRTATQVLNRLCIEKGKTMIVGGAFRRAYGGQVLMVRPGSGPCYECFLRTLPREAKDQEIGGRRQAARIAYADRPVPIEPGLANDIAPISQFMIKLAIQQLIRGHAGSLASLDEDLTAPLFQWFNRRERDTTYERLPPLGCGVNGLRVLRWQGIDLPRDPACPACVDLTAGVAARHDVEVHDADTALFG